MTIWEVAETLVSLLVFIVTLAVCWRWAERDNE